MNTEPSQFPSELARELHQDPERLDSYRRIWDLLGEDFNHRVGPSAHEAWTDIERRVIGPHSPRYSGDRRPQPRRRRLYAVASGIAALSLAAAAVFLWHQPVTVGAAPGDQRTVSLSDGSSIHLNSASKITYRRDFGDFPLVPARSRTVQLEGEAFFAIASDPVRPFIVETANARIEVLGTRFNVRVRPRERVLETVVALEEGRISVQPRIRENEPPIILETAGAMLAVRADSVPVLHPQQTSLERTLAWRTRGFAAIDEPVGDILREIEIRFGVDVELDSGLQANEPMTVFYKSGAAPEKIIHDICLARGWNYRKTSRGFAIFDPSGGNALRRDATI